MTLTGLRPDYITLKPEQAGIGMFKEGFGNRNCDYLVLSEYNGCKVAVFIELKSSATPGREPSPGKPPRYVQQLTSSACLFDYLGSILSRFLDCDILTQEYRHVFIVLHGKQPLITQTVPETGTFRTGHTPRAPYIRYVENGTSLPLSALIPRTPDE